jgi:hypothetical protein
MGLAALAIPAIAQLGGGLLQGVGMGLMNEAESREQREMREKELRENRRQFDITSARADLEGYRQQGAQGLQMLANMRADANRLARQRSFKNALYQVAGGMA